MSTTEHRAAQPVRAAIAEHTGALSLTTAWLALAVASVAQLIRLANGFNGMLREIRARDESLRVHREHLEQLVEGRTRELRAAVEEEENRG